MKKMIIAAAMSALVMGTANAADPQEEFAAVVGWGGFYAGAHIGYGTGDTDWTYVGGPTPVDVDLRGVFGGAHVGYNWELTNFVAGVEAEGNFSALNGDNFCPNPAFRCEADLKSFGSVRGRLGVANGDWLVYGHGGVAFANIEAQTVVIATGVTAGNSKNYVGWTAGAGVEKMISGTSWSWRAEYSYYDFGSRTHTVDAGLLVNFDPQVHTFRVGLTKHF